MLTRQALEALPRYGVVHHDDSSTELVPLETGRLLRLEDVLALLPDAPTAAPRPKTLHNSDQSGARQNVPDLQVVGEDLFKLLSKASSESEGWMKSTKAMNVEHGVALQVTTQQRNPDGSYAVAEAVTYIPGVYVQFVSPAIRDGRAGHYAIRSLRSMRPL